MKREVIMMYLRDKLSKREIAKQTGLSRTTVNKYLDSYNKKTSELDECVDKDQSKVIMDEIVSAPKYDSSRRQKVKLTDDVKDEIHKMLKENEEKKLTGRRKNIKKKIDIHEKLEKSGVDIGDTTVCNYLRLIQDKKEAFIRQEYDLGETIEFDWGDLKLVIEGEVKALYLGLLTTAAGFYHYSDIYHNMKMENFLDMHVNCIDHIGGVHREFLYDNLKQAVRHFVGPNEKEATEDLIKISLYYGFKYRFCNIYKPNEKGSVERGVEFVRRKVFSQRDTFNTVEEARQFLREQLEVLNSKQKSAKKNKSPKDILYEEKEYLLPLKSSYDVSRRREYRVNKYSVINIDSNKYSVPDHLVGKFVMAKIYPDRIVVLHNNIIVSKHTRSYKNHDWVIDIMHYTQTLKKKPGSLHSSVARRQLEPKLQLIYKNYYIKNPKDFIGLLEVIEKSSLEKVLKAVDELSGIKYSMVNTDNIRSIVNSAPIEPKRLITDDSIDSASMNLIVQINSLFSTIPASGYNAKQS